MAGGWLSCAIVCYRVLSIVRELSGASYRDVGLVLCCVTSTCMAGVGCWWGSAANYLGSSRHNIGQTTT